MDGHHVPANSVAGCTRRARGASRALRCGAQKCAPKHGLTLQVGPHELTLEGLEPGGVGLLDPIWIKNH
jgi:hypothetical protein